MYRVQPITITDAILTSSSLSEADYAAWSAATSYTLGQRVIRTSTHRIYEALAAVGPSATPPESDPDNWIDVSATNKWQPFDYQLADQAVGANISYTFALGTAADTLLVFNTQCESVDVLVERSGTTLLDENYAMQETSSPYDFTSWIMAVPENRPERAITIPGLPGSTVTVTFNGASVAVGQIVLGAAENWGAATWDTSFAHRSYSIIEPNDFGVRAVTRRDSTFDFNFHVVIPPERVPFVKRRVQDAEGSVAAYLGSLDAVHGSMALGIMTKMNLDYANPGSSNYTLQVEGLI